MIRRTDDGDLIVDCLTCGTEVATRLRVGERAKASATNAALRCPFGHRHAYSFKWPVPEPAPTRDPAKTRRKPAMWIADNGDWMTKCPTCDVDLYTGFTGMGEDSSLNVRLTKTCDNGHQVTLALRWPDGNQL